MTQRGRGTRLLTASGAAIQGLEPGPALADLARENLAGSPNVRIVMTTFEAADEEPGAYDLIVSATACHWTDPEVSFAKAARLPRPGGSLVLVTNAHGSTGTHTDERVGKPIRDLHRRFALEVGLWSVPTYEGCPRPRGGWGRHRTLSRRLWTQIAHEGRNPGHGEPRVSESRYYRMSRERSGPSRRAVLVAAAVLPLAGCDADDRSASGSSPTPGRRSTSSLDSSHFAALERKHGARLGVYALATGTGAMVAYRADERFAFCSTFKTLAAAAVLHRNPLSHLEERVTYTQADVNSISPITKDHIATGMTIRQLCDAAIRYSDGTAGNLLMRDIGGPARLTAYLRGLQDTISRMDNYEPELNRDPPQDPRDTTTPRAIAAAYHKLVLGEVLTADKRALLTDWLHRNTTGTQRIQAGLPQGWTVADKTGTGDYGRANDIAIVWPPTGAPLVVAIMSDRSGYDTPPEDSLIAETTTRIVSDLT